MLRCCNMSLVTCHTLMMLRCNMSLVTCDTLLMLRCNMSLVTCHTLLMLLYAVTCLLSFYFQVRKVRRVILTFESWQFHINLLTEHRTHEISTANTLGSQYRGCYHVWIVHHSSHSFFCLFIGLKHTWHMMVYHDATEALCALLPSIAKTRLPKRILKESNILWSFACRWSHKAGLKGSLAKLAAKVNKRRRWTHEERKRRGRNAVSIIPFSKSTFANYLVQ